MLVSLCQLIIEGMLLTTDSGEYRLASFIDKQKMHQLFQNFILEYYIKECPQVKAKASQIPWALDDDRGGMLPIMQSDIVTAKLFCHRNCSPKLSKNIKKLLPIMPSITAHMSYLFWSPKEKRLVHPTRDVNWRRFQEDFEEILEA